MLSGRARLLAGLAVAALLLVAVAFAVGRATRPEVKVEDTTAPAIARAAPEVALPDLEAPQRLPALRREPKATTTPTAGGDGLEPGATPTAPVSTTGPRVTSAPQVTAAPPVATRDSSSDDDLSESGGGTE